jgi:hypothetical protein
MSLPAQIPHKRFSGDGYTVAFPFDFLVLDDQEIVVYVGGQLTTAYTLTGRGVVSGGLLTFYAPPALSAEVVIHRDTLTNQPMTLQVGGVLPTVALEREYDRLTMMIQDLHEVLQRIPTLAPTVRDALRALEFPQPAASSPLIGWNATGTALTLYPTTLTFQMVSPAVGHQVASSEFVFGSIAGASELRINCLPANSRILGVVMLIDEDFGPSLGLTGLLVGDDILEDRWSRVPVALTAGTRTGEGNFGPDSQRQVDAQADLVIRAVGGRFDAAGSLTALVVYRQLSVGALPVGTPTLDLTILRSVIVIPTVDNASELRASAGLPANSRILGVPLLVETTFSAEHGITGIVCGDDLNSSRWSRDPIGLSALTETGEGSFSGDSERQVDSAADLVLRAIGGTFGAVGSATVVVHYRRLSVA